MASIVKRILGNQAENLRDKFRKDEPGFTEKNIAGFRVGGAVELNSLDWRLLKDTVNLEFPGGTHIITARGEIRLDNTVTVYRFYTEEDVFFQIVLDGERVDEVRVFRTHDSVYPTSDDDWSFWIKDDPMIGQAQFETKNGTPYDRAWMEDQEGTVMPVEYTETMYAAGDQKLAIIEHRAMLYGRWINDDNVEWLLVSAEDRGDAASVELYLGKDLSETEYSVV